MNFNKLPKLLCLLIMTTYFIGCNNKEKKTVEEKTEKTEVTKAKKKITYNYPKEGLILSLNIDEKDSIYGNLTTNRDKIEDSAITLNGYNQSIVVEDNSSLDFTGPFSISLWTKPENFEGLGFRALLNRALDESKQSPYYQYQIGINGKDFTDHPYSFHFLISLGDKIETIVSSNGSWIPNQWVNVIATYDGNYIKLYINGILDGNRAVSGVLNKSKENLIIGKHAILEKFTPGSFDEILLYNRVLSKEEIEDISLN